MTTAERPPEAQDNASSFFPGDTEMHGLVNAHDWSRTPLGPIEGWPQSLKTVVDLMLASPRPAHIAWGRNLALLYNDGYIPILGAKHRESLGRPCARLFAEIWDEYRPIAEATLAGKPQFFVDRPVPLEGPGGLPMRWFTFSWTPLRDDAGRVAGFYCATTETTSRVLAEREREDANGKLRESAERQAFLLELNVRMRAEASPDGIVAAASRMLGEYLDASRIVCAEIDDAAGTASIRQGWTAAGIETIPGELKLADFGGPLLDDLRAGKTVRYDDVGSTHARGDLAALAAIGIKAGLSVPLIVAGRFVVNLNVHQDRPRVWTDAEVRLAEAVAGQIWIALRHARVEEALRESESALADELADTQTLRRISNALVEDDSPAGLYRQILDGARALMRADFASVQKFDPERNELVLLAHHGFAAESAKHWQRVGVDCHTSCALATAQGQQAIITDAEQSADLAGTEDLAQFRRSGIRSMQSTPLISRGGHLVGMVSTHWRDVHRPSERESRLFGVVARQAADLIERHAAEERLRNSEENYRLLFDSIDEGFCIIEMLFDTNGKPFDYRFLKTNPAFGRQTGLQDAIGRSMKEMAPEHEAHWFEIYGRIALTGKPERFENRAAALGHWYDVYAFRIGEPEERRVAVLFNDIRERKRAEAALSQREEQLERANQTKDEFLAMLGHELRNPLQPIMTTLQLMRIRAPDTLAGERAIIESQVRHMTDMVDDLLDVSRIARGKLELKKVPLDIGDIILRAIDTAQPMLEEHRQTIDKAIADDLIVNGDRRRLVQIITNLLTNAAKYSPPERTIHITAGAEPDRIVVRIRDEGVGIDSELLPRVFETFIQDAQSIERAQGGLGLGLAIVHNLARMHGGSVEAKSAGRGRGSEFILRLPRMTSHAAQTTVAPRAPARRPVSRNEKLKVLIIDDYVNAAESLATLLETGGFETRVAFDGAQGIEAAIEFRPTVALIDIGLPVMNGYEVARKLRTMPGLDQTRLIAVTGYGQARDRQRAREAGFDKHLTKPFDPLAMEDMIRETAKTAQYYSGN